MIRLFIIIGVVGVVGLGYFTTYGQGPDFQMTPQASLTTKFEKEGLIPNVNELSENEELEHDIFEVPPEDEKQLEMAMESMGSMPGMNMGGMKMDDNAPKMKLNPDGTMMTNPDGSMVMEGEEKTTMKMEDEEAPHAADEATEEAPHGGEDEGGLKITEDGAFDREIELTMLEWSFSNLNIEVKAGERIRFNITNGGKIPHEFMFMTMPAMQAVSYRSTRADWSLLEHEALYEKSLVLPGGKFSFVAEVKENGSWMFMCMLPYHMQMGMMGQIATPGMAMDMKM